MKKQRLLESDSLDIFNILFIILLFTFFTLIPSFFKIKFETFEKKIIFSGILTFGIESGAILYLFYTYPFHFFSLFKKEFKKNFLKGVILYFFLIPVLSIITFFSFFIFKKLGIEPLPQKIVFLYLRINSIPVLIFLFFLSSFIAPIFEEIIFRGFLYSAFRERFSSFFSIILTSLIFSSLHSDIFVFPGIFLLSIYLAYIFEKTKNLWTCIGLHFANNFFSTLALILIKILKFT